MSRHKRSTSVEADLFEAARSYDQSIHWEARLTRELPVLRDVFGPPGRGGLLDAGCGTGHQALALAQAGYSVLAADRSPEMLAIARERVERAGCSRVRLVETTFATLHNATGGGSDGVYCLGNALAAAGTREAVQEALHQFARCLRRGGKLFCQILNFKPLCEEVPCVRGPRVSRADGVEYVSVRQFHHDGERLQVTNISLWREGSEWSQRANCGFLYPIAPEEMRDWLDANQLEIEHFWGGYDRLAFDPESSVDLIVVATRR